MDKPRELQRKLYQSAKECKERRFHALYDRIYRPDILWRAFKEVKRNGGSAGIDGVTIEEVEKSGIVVYLAKLRDELRQGTYHPHLVRRVYIPKADGSLRPLGIPCVKDRIVQQACKVVIEPIFEANFTEASFGFRPKRSGVDALRSVKEGLSARSHVVDADIRKFFDTLNHDLLLWLCRKRISDKRTLKLLRQWLKSGVMDGVEVLETALGTPQGGVISPLLANIYLHAFDMLWQRDHGHLGKLVRYADDFVIVCGSRHEAKQALVAVRGIMKRLHLELHPEKTRLVSLFEGGFDFLGFHFRKIKSPKSGKFSPMCWPSKRALEKCRAKLNSLTSRKWVMLKLTEVIKRLNLFITGWAAYFRRGSARMQLQNLDRYLDYRLVRFFYRKSKGGRTSVAQRFKTWRDSCGVARFYIPGVCGKPL